MQMQSDKDRTRDGCFGKPDSGRVKKAKRLDHTGIGTWTLRCSFILERCLKGRVVKSAGRLRPRRRRGRPPVPKAMLSAKGILKKKIKTLQVGDDLGGSAGGLLHRPLPATSSSKESCHERDNRQTPAGRPQPRRRRGRPPAPAASGPAAPSPAPSPPGGTAACGPPAAALPAQLPGAALRRDFHELHVTRKHAEAGASHVQLRWQDTARACGRCAATVSGPAAQQAVVAVCINTFCPPT